MRIYQAKKAIIPLLKKSKKIKKTSITKTNKKEGGFIKHKNQPISFS